MATAVQYTSIENVPPLKKLSTSPMAEQAAGGGGGSAAGLGAAKFDGAAAARSYNGTRTVPGKIFWKGRYIDQSIIYQVRARLHYATKPCDMGHMTV